MKHWIVATYKINEIKKVEINLSNQNFDYYLPRIIFEKNNSKIKEEVLFPGYIFINTSFENCTPISNTIGIKDIIKFGNYIPSLTNNHIKSIEAIVESSKSNPKVEKIEIGQEAIIASGPLRGNLVKVYSLPSRKRVEVLLHMLGSLKKVNISQKSLKF